MDHQALDRMVLKTLLKTKGILDASAVARENGAKILAIEQEAEVRSLMGLGKVVNVGVRKALKCFRVYAALMSTDFELGNHPSLVLKKGEETVGEEVRNQERIDELEQRDDTWFLHRNFVVFKNQMRFPQDIMEKICHFEIPGFKADWFQIEEPGLIIETMVYGFPCTPGDIFLKETFFKGEDVRGQGTLIIGITPKVLEIR